MYAPLRLLASPLGNAPAGGRPPAWRSVATRGRTGQWWPACVRPVRHHRGITASKRGQGEGTDRTRSLGSSPNRVYLGRLWRIQQPSAAHVVDGDGIRFPGRRESGVGVGRSPELQVGQHAAFLLSSASGNQRQRRHGLSCVPNLSLINRTTEVTSC